MLAGSKRVGADISVLYFLIIETNSGNGSGKHDGAAIIHVHGLDACEICVAQGTCIVYQLYALADEETP